MGVASSGSHEIVSITALKFGPADRETLLSLSGMPFLYDDT